MVGYVKGNALAGRRFASWAALASHLDGWLREVADVRIHAGTGERPLDRFVAEAAALRPLPERPPFQVGRSLLRRVHSDACIEVDGNRYSVPWQLIGAEVRVEVNAAALRILHGEAEVACHPVLVGRRGCTLDPTHLAGVVAAAPCVPAPTGAPAVPVAVPAAPPALLRPLSEYAELAGGTW